jgi:peptide/nickel transport system permease protein
MFRYLVRRLLWAVVLFFATTIVTFVIFYAIPVDPARTVCGQRATVQCIHRAEIFLGTNRPVYYQYYKFVYRLMPFSFHGGPHVHEPNLGRSFTNRLSVNYVVGQAAPVTGSLVIGAVFLWLLIAFPIGILSALRPRSLLDRGGMVFVLIGISAHPVWIGLLLAYTFGFKLGWFPITNYCNFFHGVGDCGGPMLWAYHLILPWCTFALLYAALYARMIRASMLETMNEDYVRTARAKGLPEWMVLRSHVLRNAMLPVVTILGMDIGLALGGAIFTETVFGLPGLGKTAITAVNNFDLPTVQGVVVFATVCIIVFSLTVDLLYAVIDPRIRLA